MHVIFLAKFTVGVGKTLTPWQQDHTDSEGCVLHSGPVQCVCHRRGGTRTNSSTAFVVALFFMLHFVLYYCSHKQRDVFRLLTESHPVCFVFLLFAKTGKFLFFQSWQVSGLNNSLTSKKKKEVNYLLTQKDLRQRREKTGFFLFFYHIYCCIIASSCDYFQGPSPYVENPWGKL